MPFVRVGGVFVSYKSGDIDEEVLKSKKAISLFGGKIDEVVKFQLPGTDINRAFVKIKKIKGTPKKYPRKSGIPSKEPLYGEERSNWNIVPGRGRKFSDALSNTDWATPRWTDD